MLLIPPRKMSLEQAIAYVEDDEFVEVTPGRRPPAQALSGPATSASASSARSTPKRPPESASRPLPIVSWPGRTPRQND